MGVTLQDFHGVTVRDVIEADPIGCQDLITHFYAILLCETTRVQPVKTNGETQEKHSQAKLKDFHCSSDRLVS